MTVDPETEAGPPAPKRESPEPPLTAAERMRLHRDRRRRQVRCVSVELRETEVATLIRRKFLRAELRNDRNAVTKALHAFLDRALL